MSDECTATSRDYLVAKLDLTVQWGMDVFGSKNDDPILQRAVANDILENVETMLRHNMVDLLVKYAPKIMPYYKRMRRSAEDMWEDKLEDIGNSLLTVSAEAKKLGYGVETTEGGK